MEGFTLSRSWKIATKFIFAGKVPTLIHYKDKQKYFVKLFFGKSAVATNFLSNQRLLWSSSGRSEFLKGLGIWDRYLAERPTGLGVMNRALACQSRGLGSNPTQSEYCFFFSKVKGGRLKVDSAWCYEAFYSHSNVTQLQVAWLYAHKWAARWLCWPEIRP